MSNQSPDYDDTDWTEHELLALAARAFDEADTAGPIPADPAAAPEDLTLSRSLRI